MRTVAALVVLVAAWPSIGGADSTPPVTLAATAKSDGGAWCWGQYLAAAGDAMKVAKRPAPVAARPDWVTHRRPFPDLAITLRAPASFVAQTSDVALQLWPAKPVGQPASVLDGRELGRSYEPLLQLRHFSTNVSPDALLKEIVQNPGAIFASKAVTQGRSVTVGGRVVQELCVIVDRSPGHATLVGGGHVPLPYEREMLRGYSLRLDAATQVLVFYRVPYRELAMEPTFAAILETLALTR